jgi:hypothetical protein
MHCIKISDPASVHLQAAILVACVGHDTMVLSCMHGSVNVGVSLAHFTQAFTPAKARWNTCVTSEIFSDLKVLSRLCRAFKCIYFTHDSNTGGVNDCAGDESER